MYRDARDSPNTVTIPRYYTVLCGHRPSPFRARLSDTCKLADSLSKFSMGQAARLRGVGCPTGQA